MAWYCSEACRAAHEETPAGGAAVAEAPHHFVCEPLRALREAATAFAKHKGKKPSSKRTGSASDPIAAMAAAGMEVEDCLDDGRFVMLILLQRAWELALQWQDGGGGDGGGNCGGGDDVGGSGSSGNDCGSSGDAGSSDSTESRAALKNRSASFADVLLMQPCMELHKAAAVTAALPPLNAGTGSSPGGVKLTSNAAAAAAVAAAASAPLDTPISFEPGEEATVRLLRLQQASSPHSLPPAAATPRPPLSHRGMLWTPAEVAELAADWTAGEALRLLIEQILPPEMTEGDMIRQVMYREKANAFGHRDDTEDLVGFVLSPQAVFFNHDCRANVRKRNIGRDVVFEAVGDIRKGEELTIYYGEEGDVATRRLQLRRFFFFDCVCGRCTEEASGEAADCHE